MLTRILMGLGLVVVTGCTINITTEREHEGFEHEEWREDKERHECCLLYTSDAADE